MSRFSVVLLLLAISMADHAATAAPAPGAGPAPAPPAAPAVPAVVAVPGSWNSLLGIGDAIMGPGAVTEVQAYDTQDYATSARYMEVFHRLNPSDTAIAKRLGFAYKEIGRYEEAHDLLFQATVETPDDYIVWWWLSDTQRLLGEYEKAYDSILTSRDSAPENARQEIQQYVDYTESLGSKVPAWATFEKHAEFARRHEKNRRVRRVIAEYMNALESVPAPQGKREDNGPGSRAFVNNQIGIQYNQLKQPEMALEYFWRSLRLSKELKSRPDEMMVYQNLGVTYRVLGDKVPARRQEYFTLAFQYWDETVKIATELSDVDYTRYSRAGQLLCALEAFGVSDPRVVDLRAANLKELPWRGPVNEFTTGTVALAELACRMSEKDYAGARVVGEMAVEFYSKSGFLLDNEEGMRIYLQLAQIFTQQGHYDEALKNIELADQVLARLRVFMDADAFTRSINPTALAGIATARARAGVLSGDFNAALRGVEIYRLQTRMDLVGARVVEQASTNDYATEKELLARGLVLLEKDLAAIDATSAPEEGARLAARIAEDKLRLTWLDKGVRFAAAEAVSYRSVPRLGAMERATGWPADTQMVSVISDEYGGVALVSDAQTAWGVELPALNTNALRGLADAAVAALAAGPDAALPALDALSAQVLAPMQDRLTAKTLYFGVDAALAAVPCELLRSQGNFLIAAHDVAYTPCTSYLIHTEATPKVESTAVRIVAAEADSAPLKSALPTGTLCATELCAAHAADSAGLVVLGAPMDLTVIDSMLASISLAGEGIYDGTLYAAELLGARVNSNGVWLIPGVAADAWRADRFVGFDEGFLQAGARQLVRPILPLSAAAQARLLPVGAGGAVTLEALSAAKRAALAENPADLSAGFVGYFGAAR